MTTGESEWQIYTEDHKYVSPCLGNECDREWKGDFCFVFGADPQYGMHWDEQHPGGDRAKSNWDWEINNSNIAVDMVNRMNPKPRFFFICGDMSHEKPDGLTDLKSRQIADFKKIFGKVNKDIPLLCACGNHDVGDHPTVDAINSYRDTFGDDYYSFWCGGIFFIVLNSQFYKDPQFVQQMAREQDQWLDDELRKAAGSRIIVFSHVPWFDLIPGEWNWEGNIPTPLRFQMLDKLKNAGVRHCFCGHLHQNAGGVYEHGAVKVVVSSAIGHQLGISKPGIRIVNVFVDRVESHYENLPDV